MNIRALTPYDVWKIKKIHEKHFAEEFDFPNFFENFLNAYIVESNDSIVAAGGVRPIAEAILITDKDKSVRERREALYQILAASLFTCGRLGYSQLHAFTQDKKWTEHLLNIGFHHTKGEALVIEV